MTLQVDILQQQAVQFEPLSESAEEKRNSRGEILLSELLIPNDEINKSFSECSTSLGISREIPRYQTKKVIKPFKTCLQKLYKNYTTKSTWYEHREFVAGLLEEDIKQARKALIDVMRNLVVTPESDSLVLKQKSNHW